jgi:hypothetical protein
MIDGLGIDTRVSESPAGCHICPGLQTAAGTSVFFTSSDTKRIHSLISVAAITGYTQFVSLSF